MISIVTLLSVIIFSINSLACNLNNGSNAEPAVSQPRAPVNSGDTAKAEDTTKPENASSVSPKSDDLDINNLPEEISGFVPAGYVPLKAVSGDLNLDRFKDVILVVKHPDEENQDQGDNFDRPKRPLLILIGQAGGKYKLAAQNLNTVLCYRCGGVFGDPFEGLAIKKGFFSVEHYGGSNWRWTKTITYKYSPTDKNWYLHRVDSSSFHTSDPDKSKDTAKTVRNFGKVRFDKYNVFEDIK